MSARRFMKKGMVATRFTSLSGDCFSERRNRVVSIRGLFQKYHLMVFVVSIVPVGFVEVLDLQYFEGCGFQNVIHGCRGFCCSWVVSGVKKRTPFLNNSLPAPPSYARREGKAVKRAKYENLFLFCGHVLGDQARKLYGPVALGTSPTFLLILQWMPRLIQGQTQSVPGTSRGRRAADKVYVSKSLRVSFARLTQSRKLFCFFGMKAPGLNSWNHPQCYSVSPQNAGNHDAKKDTAHPICWQQRRGPQKSLLELPEKCFQSQGLLRRYCSCLERQV